MDLSGKPGQREGVVVGLARPFPSVIMTATERGGSPPSRALHVLGWYPEETLIRYARLRL